VTGGGSGSTCADAAIHDGVAQIRAERSGQGTVSVCISHDQGRKKDSCIGDGSATWTVANPAPTGYFVQLRVGEKAVAMRIFFSRREQRAVSLDAARPIG